jgi:hypothetical protein|tara:strand:+ start:308 stop:586 length:279 start_codon:yes stop_codon:yes gene_type:complete
MIEKDGNMNSRLNWNLMLCGWMVNWANMWQVGEFELDREQEMVYDNVETQWVTLEDFRTFIENYNENGIVFNLTEYLDTYTDVNENYIGRVD